MTVREYIGARYITVFDGAWNSTKEYEPLTIVQSVSGDSYVSKRKVPAGILLTNDDYWFKTFDFNAQMADIQQTNQEQNEKIISNMFGGMNFENSIPYVRHEVPLDGSRRTSAQGFAAFKSGSNIVSACYFANQTGTGSSATFYEGFLKSYFNDTEVSTVRVNLGHGSHMEYYNNYIYISDNQYLHKVVRYPISASGVIGNKEELFTIPGGAFTIDSETGQGYLVGVSTIRQININTGALGNEITAHFDLPVDVNGQTGFCFRMFGQLFFGFLASFPNLISIVDVEGNHVCTKRLPQFAGFVNVAEIEAMHIFEDGTYYFCANEGTQDSNILKTFIGVTGNIFDSNANVQYPDYAGHYAVIYFYGNSPQYKFPAKTGITEISGTTAITCYYSQDIQSIVAVCKQMGYDGFLISVMENCSQSIFLTGFNGQINFNNNVIEGKLLADKSIITLRNGQAQLDSKARAVEMRLGSVIYLLDTFTTAQGLRLNFANAIVKYNQDITKIYVEGSGDNKRAIVVKAELYPENA